MRVFHPPLVHFPIAFYFLEFFLLLFWILRREESFLKFSAIVFKFAFAAMMAAMAAGYRDSGGLNPKIQNHFFAALSTLVIQSMRGILWFRMNRSKKFNPWILGIGSLMGVVSVIVTADLGGDLVYGS